MFSFFRNYAATIHSIEIYPKIAMCIFMLVFAAMILIAIKADKNYIKEVERLPLQ